MSDSNRRHPWLQSWLCDKPLSRRGLFPTVMNAGAIFAALWAFRNVPAKAQPKVSKQAAKYQDYPNNGQECDDCRYFRPPKSCQLVEGNISPHGWCSFFMKKEG